MFTPASRTVLGLGLLGLASAAMAGGEPFDSGWKSGSCAGLPNHHQLQTALENARGQANGGFDLDMWATVVNRDGVVCEIAFTGQNRGSQWPGSRVISAQKANTANAFSLPGLALSTANLFAAVQPGGSLYGLQHSNPVDTAVAYRGPAANFGLDDDPMEGRRIGGVNVFGGGLALYDAQGEIIGALGVSGDTSCADHNIAWKARDGLALDYVPGGVGDGGADDNIIYDIQPDGTSPSGFGHPECSAQSIAIAQQLATTHPIGG